MCVLLLYTDHTPFRSPPPPQFRYVAGDDPHELPPRQAQADAVRVDRAQLILILNRVGEDIPGYIQARAFLYIVVGVLYTT